MDLKNVVRKVMSPAMHAIGVSGEWGSCLKSILFYKTYSKKMDTYIEKYILYKPSKEQVKWLKKDYLRFNWKHGGSIDVDYFESKMYRKSEFTRMESMAVSGRFAWRDSIQNKEDWPIFTDKRKFYAAYSDSLCRSWMIITPKTTAEELLRFAQKCNNDVFIKDPIGCGGKAVTCYRNINNDNVLSLLKKIQEENAEYIIEGHIQQCKEIFEFSNSSVNTFRIITLIDQDGNVHIANALLRIGCDSEVDNFSSGGMAAHVDVDSGVIYTTAMNGRGKSSFFIRLQENKL